MTMADQQTTLAELIQQVVAFEAERDWAQFHDPKNLAMGLSIEAGELLERFLWMTPEETRKIIHDPRQSQAVGEEMADVLAYLLYLAHHLGIDLSEAFRNKMIKNAEKYPADAYRGKYRL